jgi:CDP-glycerol glycerophosphotransferase
MLREMETRGNQRKDVLHYAYNHFDHVAVVTEDMVDSTVEISGRRDNIHVAKNLIDYPTILSKGEAEITLDPTTKTSVDEEEIRRILSSDSERFISVGRFSPEKGHDRLVAAFAKYHQKQPDSYLFIMGGSSMNNGYQKLLDYVHELGLQEYVVLLEQVSNPYPIVKACDYFVLSSHYEGFGLVLVEADLLGLTVVSTDIPGPRGFMKKYGGTLVENSEAGILEGMEMLHNGQVSPLTVDYAQYNQEAVAEFEAIMSNTAKSMGEKIVL